MTYDDRLLELKGELQQASERIKDWKSVLGSKEWQALSAYIKTRYLELSDEDVDSVKKLANRNGAMGELRRLFRFIQADIDIQKLRLEQIERELNEDLDDAPLPHYPL